MDPAIPENLVSPTNVLLLQCGIRYSQIWILIPLLIGLSNPGLAEVTNSPAMMNGATTQRRWLLARNLPFINHMSKVFEGFGFVTKVGFLAVVLFSCLSANAAKHVRAGATGAGSGNNWTDAYPSLPSSLVRGETYYIADGSYGGFNGTTLESGSTAITIKKATIADHGVSTGWSDAYGDGQAVFGSITIMTDNWVIDGAVGGGPGSWTTGHGFVINGEVGVNPSWNTVHAWSSGHGDNVQILRCKIVGTANGSSGTDAVHADFVANLRVAYCYTVNTDNCPLHTFQITDPIIEYNYFDFFAAGEDPAVHGEIWSCDNQDGNYIGATVRWNVFRWCHSTGGLMFAGTDVTIYGNVFYREAGYKAGKDWVGNHGLIGGWSNPNSQWRNIKVYNNTFVGINQSAPRPLGSLGPSGGVSGNIAKNNLFYDSGAEGYGLFTTIGNNTWTSGNPFVTLSVLANDFAKLTSDTAAADSSVPAQYRTDWFGNVGTSRGALQPTGGGNLTANAGPDKQVTLPSSTTLVGSYVNLLG